MREIGSVIAYMARNTYSMLRATRVGFIVMYHLTKFVFLGDYDKRMIELIRDLSERSPLYVKVFQSLAGSSGFLNQTVQDYLTTFSDSVPFSGDDERYDYLREKLAYISGLHPGLEVTELSHTPIHSGTISLVYSGKIGTDDVVIKCVRRGVYANMVRAIEEAEYIISVIDQIPSIKCLGLPNVLNENKMSLLEQTSMRHELDNLVDLRKCLDGRDYIVTPKPYPEFTNIYDDILVMKRLSGRCVEEIRDDEKEDYGLLLAQQAVDAILNDGIYHADLHRGNILFMTDDLDSENTPKTKKMIGILDFGIMGRLTESEKLILSSFYISLGMGNYDDVMSSLIGTISNNNILEEMERSEYDLLIKQLVNITEDACNSKDGFTPAHLRKINSIFMENGLKLAPVFCRIEMALAMNMSVSRSLETKNRNFMSFLQEVIQSKMDLSVYDV